MRYILLVTTCIIAIALVISEKSEEISGIPTDLNEELPPPGNGTIEMFGLIIRPCGIVTGQLALGNVRCHRHCKILGGSQSGYCEGRECICYVQGIQLDLED